MNSENTQTTYSPPVLYKTPVKKNSESWSIRVEPNTNVMTPVFGIIKTYTTKYSGSLDIDTKVIYEGKNIGTPEETTAMEEAIREARKSWEMKVASGWVTKKDDKITYDEPTLVFRATERVPLTAGSLMAFLQKAIEKDGPDIKIVCDILPMGHAVCDTVEFSEGGCICLCGEE